MAEGSLQDRLRDHAKAFDGLLSLIPAKMYYGEDNTDQWKKKKQTKAEAKAARKSKLDPDSELHRNAKEVMDERAKNKRKLRDLEQANEGDNDAEDEEYELVDGVEAEKPGEGLKRKSQESNKKQKLDDKDDEKEEEEEAAAEDGEDAWEDEEDEAKPEESTETEASKLSKKQEKLAAKKEKRKQKKADKKSRDAEQLDSTSTAKESSGKKSDEASKPQDSKKKQAVKEVEAAEDDNDVSDAEEDEEMGGTESKALDFSGLQESEAESTSQSGRDNESPTFDTNGPNGTTAEAGSTSTSLSSAVPPSEKPKHIKIPSDTSALRARLAAKIEQLRAARKADGPDGKPIRTRQELIESRREKEAQRKAHKKELRLKAKLEENEKREQALASNSPSVMSPAVELDEATGNFSFGRVAFGDGTQLSHDLSYVLNNNKKKGPSDPKTALIKVQNQKKRLEQLDEDKRKDIADKEAWLVARRRVEGDKIRDDEAALKKTIKRKESSKRKSEKAWKERASGVHLAQKERQKKREENIKKRREDKILGKAGKKKKPSAGKKKSGGRPGFEGSLGVGARRK